MTNLCTYQLFFQPVHSPPHRGIATIVACFDAVHEPGLFTYHVLTTNALQIFCGKWGNIGKLDYEEIKPGKSQIRLEPPQAINSDDLSKYEILVREEILGFRGRLAEMLGQEDIVKLNLMEALYEKRFERQQEFIAWLIGRLQIFGYHNLPPGLKSDTTETIEEYFDFPIRGTPAEFGVMLRQFTQMLHSQTEYHQLVCQFLNPGNHKDASSITSDANPVEVKLTIGKNQLSIHAHVLPSTGSLLRIHLNGDRYLWFLWDKIRDELEKLGWFSLPNIPEKSALHEVKPELQPEEKFPPVEVWMGIPDVGANREVLRLWHQGLTCGQISVRVGLNGKTVLNRINKLRKEFGIQIVPYRKSNFIKKPKDIPS
jgi:hypothetical protein